MPETFPAAPRRAGMLPPRGLLIALVAQAPLVVLLWPLNPSWPWRAAGAAALLAGVGLNLWADVLFKRGRVPVCPFHPVPRLVQEGPYRYTRNPMYLGMVLISASAALLTGALPNLAIALLFALWLQLRFVLPEERFLLEQLGPAFEAYATRIPRWIGGPKR